MKLLFGDIVVVEEDLIGVIVKSFENENGEYNYDVYVRSFNAVENFSEKDVERFKIRHEELNDEDIFYQKNS